MPEIGGWSIYTSSTKALQLTFMMGSNHYLLYSPGGICDSWAKENCRKLWCLRTQTENVDLSFYSTKQLDWIFLSVSVLTLLVLAGKSLFRMLFIGVLLILLGPFTSHSTQGDLPDDPGPSSSRPKKASLQHLSVGQSPTASCFIELAAASILFL